MIGINKRKKKEVILSLQKNHIQGQESEDLLTNAAEKTHTDIVSMYWTSHGDTRDSHV